MKWPQANRERRCLICGEPQANLLRLADGRNVRACDRCLRSTPEWINGSTEREPLACELPPGQVTIRYER